MEAKKYSLNNIAPVGSYHYTHSSALFLPQLLQSVLSSKDKVLREIDLDGMLLKTLPELRKAIEDQGGRLVKENKGDVYIYLFKDHSYLTVDYTKKENSVSICAYTANPDIVELMKFFEKDFVSEKKTNLIFTIIKTSDGFSYKNMGDGSIPLIKENYLSKVIEDFNEVIEANKKAPPIGRITIINGEPGTGKTYLIRSILKELDCVFLIVPANLIDSLDKPEFMPLLLQIKRDQEKPIIMIMEDGDACLVPRRNDNISAIASLLNLSDGILGSMLDIRMIISTNAHIHDMDPAILRAGRLCKNIIVGALPYEQANNRYKQLTKNDSLDLEYRKEYTIAEVYNVVNHTNSTTSVVTNLVSQERRVIGFAAPSKNQDLTLNTSRQNIK